MKKAFLCLTASAFFAIISCNKDDNNDGGGIISVENDPAEEVALDATEVSQNIEIAGATKVQGNAPAPNGSLTFSIDDTNQSAFQKNGFEIKLQAPDDIAGTYIQVKGEDGVASEYFDVPAGLGKSSLVKNNKRNVFASKSATAVDTEIEIDVDFIDVPPGKFCYLICVYTDEGFVSAPSEVCVDVEAWGGNPNLIGTWNFSKSVEDGVSTNIGDEDCEPQQNLSCANGSSITVEDAYCYTVLSLPITFNENGTYSYTAEEKDKELDFGATIENCEPVFNTETFSVTSKGNWAYDEEEGKLTLVEFEYIENGETELYDNGFLLFDGKATIDTNSLIIRDTYDEDGVEFTSEFYFTK